MKELVIISGKGGTGKTSLTAALATLAQDAILVDADVDAADLHLILEPSILAESDFKGGHIAVIDAKRCEQCGECRDRCQFDAIKVDTIKVDAIRQDFTVDQTACEGCGVCVRFCPADAIGFPRRVCGKWFISDTRCGPMIHARLGIAEENSGKLVSLLRKEARDMGAETDAELILIDGPPGIGCPAIASVTGADWALIVTEPTLSGRHDMERAKGLCDFLNVRVMICINKYDIYPEMAAEIERYAEKNGIPMVGKIPYDPVFTAAMIEKKSVMETGLGPAAAAISDIWKVIEEHIQEIEQGVTL